MSRSWYAFLLTLLLLGAAASRAGVFATWWCLDDWGQLARAVGIAEAGPGIPARWLSQHLWWRATVAVFGTSVVAHASLRILLHAASVALVVRIALLLRLGREASLVAGALFAATPIAFTALYWASGIQETLAVACALASIERWLQGGRKAAVASIVFGALSIISKEPGFVLCLLYGATLVVPKSAIAVDNAGLRRFGAVALAAIVMGESLLIVRHFDTGAGGTYQFAGLDLVVGNLGVYGRWLTTLGPRFESETTWTYAIGGLVLWAVWLALGVMEWRRRRFVVLASAVFAMGSLGPALLLASQSRPYMGYLATAALALALASPIRRVRINLAPVLVPFIVGTSVLCYMWTGARMDAVRADGLPADPIVRAAHVARQASASLAEARRYLPHADHQRIVIYQPPLRPSDYARIAAEGPSAVVPTQRHAALGGDLGPAIILGERAPVSWVGDLGGLDSATAVLCATKSDFSYLGVGDEARTYGAVLHMVVGHFESAWRLLLPLIDDSSNRAFGPLDAGRLPVAPQTIRQSIRAFLDWSDGAIDDDSSEVGGVRRARLEGLLQVSD